MEHFLSTKDFLVSGEEFVLLKDGSKDLLITTPKPADLTTYYQSPDYISHTDSKKGIVGRLYQWVKKYAISGKIKLFLKYAAGNRSLLDVGAGTGDLLIEAKKNGFEIFGVEPNKSARQKANEKGIVLHEEYPTDRKFQIISLWHVLEHLNNPDEEIAKLKSLLKDEGTLFIAVPNYNSYDANFYKEYWAAYDVPRHLWHFSRTAMKMLCEKHGLSILDVKPMAFDSFYVSLLSEKYKSGSSNFFKAMKVGFVSNQKAKRTGEYSSLLYIIKKG